MPALAEVVRELDAHMDASPQGHTDLADTVAWSPFNSGPAAEPPSDTVAWSPFNSGPTAEPPSDTVAWSPFNSGPTAEPPTE